MTELAVAVDSPDPATGLAAVAALRKLTDELEALHVRNARAQGWSWEAIASSLGRAAPVGAQKARQASCMDAAGRLTWQRSPGSRRPRAGPSIRAGMLASDYGRGRLSTEFFLLALAEDQPLSRPVDLGITAAAIRAEIKARTHARRDRELLAALGIDLDEIRRRVLDATSTRLDDPSLWRLRRSRVRPLRVTLSGPAAEIVARRERQKGHRSRPMGQPPRTADPDRPRRPALGAARRRFQ